MPWPYCIFLDPTNPESIRVISVGKRRVTVAKTVEKFERKVVVPRSEYDDYVKAVEAFAKKESQKAAKAKQPEPKPEPELKIDKAAPPVAE